MNNLNNTLKKLIIIVTILLSFTGLKAQFNGTYSIGPSGNFDSIQKAIDSLVLVGVSGPATFEIDSGYYYDYFYFQPIPGASETNHITFKAKNDSVNDVVIYNTVYFLGGDYITLKSLTVNNSCNCIKLQDGSDHITIDSCILEGLNVNSNNRIYDVIYSDMYSNNSYTTIKDCKITNGSCGIYMQANTNNPDEKGHVIINNEISNSYVHAIGFANVDSTIVSNNRILGAKNTTLTGAAGIILNNSSNALVNNNIIYAKKHGIRLHNNKDENDTIRVFNNMVTSYYAAANYFPLYLSAGNKNAKIFNNSFYNTYELSNGALKCQYDYYENNVELVNNIFSSASPYTGIIENSYTHYTISHNDFYNNDGSGRINIGGIWYANLEEAQEYIGENNVSIDPQFFADDNLHVGNSMLGDLGTPLSEINVDIDGDYRDLNSPDIGADEFDPYDSNDIAITAIDFPQAPICSAPIEFAITFKNIGAEIITEYKVERTKNNIVVDTLTFTTNLESYEVETGTFEYGTFNDGDSITYRVVEVNGEADPTPDNNAYENNGIWLALSQDVTISSSEEFDSIFNEIRARGLCSSVEVSLLPGVYQNRLRLFEIPGSGPDAILTVKSSTGNREDVILAPDNASNFVIDLKGTDYVTFKDLTLSADTISSYGVYFNGDATNLTFDNLHIKADIDGSYEGIYSSSGDDHNLTISNCLIENGDYAIYLEGDSEEDSIRIINNTILNSEYGIYLQDVANTIINNNYIKIDSSYSAYGFEIYEVYGYFEMMNNQVIIDSTSGAGADIEYIYGSGAKSSLIANNVFSIGGNPWAGIYFYELANTKFYNNTLKVESNSVNDYALYLSYFTVLDIRNNHIVTEGEATPILFDELPMGVTNMDYNNIFTTGARFANYNGTNIDSLEQWQQIGWDANSVSIDPEFYEVYKSCSSELNNKGIFVEGVPLTDLNGVIRNTSTPDIGAVEFGIPEQNFLGDDFLLCESSYVIDAGPNSVSYLWNTGETTQSITVSEPNQYYVEITSECGISLTDTIEVKSSEVIADFEVYIAGSTVALVNASEGVIDNYLWSFNGISSSNEHESFIFSGNGDYYVSLEVSNQCSNDYADTTLTFVGIGHELIGVEELKLYPNPIDYEFNVEFISTLTKTMDFAIYNVNSQLLMTFQKPVYTGNNQLNFEVPNLKSGVYFLQIDNSREVLRLIKQ